MITEDGFRPSAFTIIAQDATSNVRIPRGGAALTAHAALRFFGSIADCDKHTTPFLGRTVEEAQPEFFSKNPNGRRK